MVGYALTGGKGGTLAVKGTSSGERVPVQVPSVSKSTTNKPGTGKEVRTAGRASSAASTTQPKVSLDDAPDPGSGLLQKDTRVSPLHGVISQGLAELAQSEGWNEQQSALGSLAAKLMSTTTTTGSTGRVDELSERSFVRMLALRADPSQRKKAIDDGKKLAEFATVALGTDGLENLGKAGENAQLRQDLAEVQAALAHVLAQPNNATYLEKLAQDVEHLNAKWVEPSGQKSGHPRLQAVVGIVRILRDYAKD